MSQPAIEVSGLSKRYVIQRESRHDNLRDTLHHSARKVWRKLRWGTGFEKEDFWALRDVSFSVQPGEVLGIIGRNGAGKSTLLKILSRITEPTAGKVTLRGRVASLLEVGTGFHGELSGRENIFLNGAILGMHRAEIKAKFDEIVAFAEVDQFLDTPVKRYSSGMYVRLAFAVAAHLEPEILIVDEVLAVGDAAFQNKCLGKMRDVASGAGRTVLFVSHNIGAVRGLCNKCLWLDNGQLKAYGDTPIVSADYMSETSLSTGRQFDLKDSGSNDETNKPLSLKAITFDNSTKLQHGEPLTIILTFITRAPLDDVSLGIGFSNLEGTRLMTIESDLPGPRLSFTNPGIHSIRCQVDQFHMQPGTYTIDLGARAGDFAPLDYVASAAIVEVIPGSTTRDTLLRSSPHVRYPSRWITQ